jgi:ketol-acid reductoisomerase
MARFFEQKEADPNVLTGKKIAVVGYGNQGRAQAINLRRAGHDVIIGNQRDSSWDQACEDHFDPVPIDTASAMADITLMLLPDDIAPEA